jgi:predicted nucleic acid-binding protein
MAEFRFIADTNVLISNLLFYQSVPARALQMALDLGVLLTSQAALDELATV